MPKLSLKVDFEELKETIKMLPYSEIEILSGILQKNISKKKLELKTIDAKDLEGLIGIVSIGGDAVEDAEKLYE